MKKLIIIGTLIILGIFTLNAQSKNNDDFLEKTFHKIFKVNKNANLTIENTFGNIFLNSWDKNEIDIEVIIKIESDVKNSKLKSFFDEINILISGTDDWVKAITEIPHSSLNLTNLDLSINYYISLPETIKLDINNKYGNVNLNTNWTGQTLFNIKYGGLYLRDLTHSNNEIKVNYGHLYGDNIQNAEIKSSYSDIQLESVNTSNMDISFSNLEIGKSTDLEIDSDYSDINIEHITNISAHLNFCEVSIDKFYNLLDIETNYGHLSIDHITPEFKSIDIESKNTNIEIDVDESASYDLEVNSKYGELYSKNKHLFTKVTDDVWQKSYKYKGSIGSSKNKSKIFIEIEYANVEIK